MNGDASPKLSRRRLLSGLGAAAAGCALVSRRALAQPAPAVLKGTTLTVSSWGDTTLDNIKEHLSPEFERQTGAKLAFDIGGQGVRYNKLLAQKGRPSIDVFFGTDEAIVGGFRSGILIPASRKSLPNAVDIYDWAFTVKGIGDADTVPGIPYSLFAYVLAYNPNIVKDKPTSWADLWRPDFANKLAFCSPVHSMMPALVVLASELAGGNASSVDPGFKKLAQLRPSRLTVFWTDWAPLLKVDEVIVATETDHYIESMKDQGYPIDYVLPTEKAIGSVDYASIVAGTPIKEVAEVFLNLMAEAKLQEILAERTYQGPINKKVRLSAAVAARTPYGAKLEKLRFFDPVMFFENRPIWTERLNTEIVPNWRTR